MCVCGGGGGGGGGGGEYTTVPFQSCTRLVLYISYLDDVYMCRV